MRFVLAVLLVAACGRSAAIHAPMSLELSSSGAVSQDGGVPTIDLQSGETRLLELIVIGAASGPVQFSAANLPPFATLQGPLLTIAPVRKDAGSYTLTLTASAGSESSGVTLNVIVHRANTAPTVTFAFFPFAGDNRYYFSACSLKPAPTTCTAGQGPYVRVGGMDAERDAIVADVEVVPRGQPFRNLPTHSATARQPNLQASVNFDVPLSGLILEQSYDLQVRISDEFGAVMIANVDGVANAAGWFAWGGFDQGPCTTRQCACMSSGMMYCDRGSDCCSGVCIGTPYQGIPGRTQCQ
jgi:hypothetical protein